MAISFETVLPTVKAKVAEDQALQAQLFPRVQAVTIIRDATGLVRLLLEPLPGTELKEDDPDVQKLQTLIAKELGEYFGKDVWYTKKHFAVLDKIIDLARKERIPARWDAPNANPRWYVVERHVAKHLWTGHVSRQLPWPVEPVELGKRPAVVTFFSFKGGIGRTTALAGTAIALARKGHRVAMVDIDLEAPGLSTLFAREDGGDVGVLDYLIEKRVQKDKWPLRPSVKQINHSSIIGVAGEPLRLLSAGRVDENYLEKLARIDFQHLTDDSRCGLLCDMLHELDAATQKLDFMLLDARAGFHDLGGFALSSLSHGAVLLASHNRQNWAGVIYAVELLARPLEPKADPVPLVLVHAMAPPLNAPGREQTLREFKDKAYQVFRDHYYSDEETIPNSNDTDAPFSPVEMLWQDELRGDILLAPRDDTQEEQKRVGLLVTQLATACEPIAEKVCRLFGRPYEQREAKRD